MGTLRTLSLLVATVSTALGAGVFADWSHTVMPGLGHTDDRTFVTAFQQLDQAIMNGWFIGFSFLGALVFGIVAAVLNARRPVLRWIVLALVLHLVVVVVTMSINVPLNDALRAAGDPGRISDLAAVRAAFDEATWRAWNLVRTLLDVAAFASLAWALVLHGRATAGSPHGGHVRR